MQAARRVVLGLRIGLALALMSMLGATGARAEDKLLAEAVDFTGTFIYLGAKVPGLVIGATRNGETEETRQNRGTALDRPRPR